MRLVNYTAQRENIILLIYGESGTGKELTAKQFHEATGRKGPLIVVSCANIKPELMESELMGADKGAYTGATRDRKGLIEQADGGTLFLDEIGCATPRVQAQLLRFIQEKEIRRVGGSRPFKVDVRIVAATNQNLFEMCQQNLFRSDLYYRLAGMPVTLPPLRDRGEDAILIARKTMKELPSEGYMKQTLSKEAEKVILDYSWPGNVRELNAALRRIEAFRMTEKVSTEIVSADKMRKAIHQHTQNPQAVPSVEIPPTEESHDEPWIQVLNLIKEKSPIKTSDIRKETGIPKTTLFRILARLVEEGQIIRFKTTRDFYYTHRDDSRPMMKPDTIPNNVLFLYPKTKEPEQNSAGQNCVGPIVIEDTLPQHSETMSTQERILDTISQKRVVSAAELEVLMQTSRSSVTRGLNKLIATDKVRRIGKGKRTRYTLADEQLEYADLLPPIIPNKKMLSPGDNDSEPVRDRETSSDHEADYGHDEQDEHDNQRKKDDLNEQHWKLYNFIAERPRTRNELMQFLSIKHRYYFRKKWLAPLINGGLIRMAFPDKPQSRRQKYQVNAAARDCSACYRDDPKGRNP